MTYLPDLRALLARFRPFDPGSLARCGTLAALFPALDISAIALGTGGSPGIRTRVRASLRLDTHCPVPHSGQKRGGARNFANTIRVAHRRRECRRSPILRDQSHPSAPGHVAIADVCGASYELEHVHAVCARTAARRSGGSSIIKPTLGTPRAKPPLSVSICKGVTSTVSIEWSSRMEALTGLR